MEQALQRQIVALESDLTKKEALIGQLEERLKDQEFETLANGSAEDGRRVIASLYYDRDLSDAYAPRPISEILAELLPADEYMEIPNGTKLHAARIGYSRKAWRRLILRCATPDSVWESTDWTEKNELKPLKISALRDTDDKYGENPKLIGIHYDPHAIVPYKRIELSNGLNYYIISRNIGMGAIKRALLNNGHKIEYKSNFIIGRNPKFIDHKIQKRFDAIIKKRSTFDELVAANKKMQSQNSR